MNGSIPRVVQIRTVNIWQSGQKLVKILRFQCKEDQVTYNFILLYEMPKIKYYCRILDFQKDWIGIGFSANPFMVNYLNYFTSTKLTN